MTDEKRAGGTLYLVSTPIGNLEDITLRALRILKEVDLVAAEDTRRTGMLLKHFSISNRLDSYHDHNKIKKTPRLLEKLIQGQQIALVSDAGTPGISDPAYRLVTEAANLGIQVVPVPGPTALISGLIVSGLGTDRFVFEGFLPVKKGRKTRIERLKEETRTLVFYESPHRILRTLNDLHQAFGDRRAAVARELTKKFEETLRNSLEQLIEHFKIHQARGEFVLVVEGKSKKK